MEPKKKVGAPKGRKREPLTVMLPIEKIEKVGGKEKARVIIQKQFEKL
jgi:hypothetical protein